RGAQRGRDGGGKFPSRAVDAGARTGLSPDRRVDRARRRRAACRRAQAVRRASASSGAGRERRPANAAARTASVVDDAARAPMGAALHEVTATRRAGLVGLFPALTVAAFMLPIVAGLAGTLLPAFGYLPAIGGDSFGIDSWRRLFAYPGIATSIVTSVSTGFAATILSFCFAVAFCAVAHARSWGRRLGGLVAPVLAMPHAAVAIGVAFLISPSVWIAP